jgi:hypothetical protein
MIRPLKKIERLVLERSERQPTATPAGRAQLWHASRRLAELGLVEIVKTRPMFGPAVSFARITAAGIEHLKTLRGESA